MSEPKKGSRLPYIVAAILLVPVLGYTIATGLGGGTFGLRQKAAEAKLNVRLLARAAVKYHEQSREWRGAGPTPSTIPGRDAVPFQTNEDWDALGFNPGKARYQYQLQLTTDAEGKVLGVRAVAKGDLDDDGTLATYSIWVNPSTRDIGQIEMENELE